jgi:uncharacterized repeat protein (TIGR02543 family)/LPXTG-motif cell wall-anchored protein
VSGTNLESASGLADGKVDRIDDNDDDAALQTKIYSAVESPDLASLVYDIQFVRGGTSTAVLLQNVSLTVRDVDANQYVQFAGLSSYKLASGRDTAWDGGGDVDAYTGAVTLTGARRDTVSSFAISRTVPAGSVLFFASGESASSDENHWVNVNFASVSNLRVTLGAYEAGSASFDLDFSVAPFTSPEAPVSVSQPSFTVSYDANGATGTAPSSTIGSGQLTLAGNSASPIMTKEGFVFKGWNTRADGTGTTYKSGGSILPVADVTLYAIWGEPSSDLANTGSDSTLTLGAASLMIGLGSLILIARRRRA